MKITKKELNKRVNAALKGLLKEYGYKTRGGVLYKMSGDYFISIVILGAGLKNNLICALGTVKPFFFDDVFWEVFQMQENLKAPVGLRANGAFAVRGLEIYDQRIEIEDYDNVEKYVEKLLKECDTKIMELINKIGGDFREFINYSESIENPGLYNNVLSKMLLEIKEKNYQKAKELAINELKNYRSGHFENLGKDIYEYVVDFCEDKCKD